MKRNDLQFNSRPSSPLEAAMLTFQLLSNYRQSQECVGQFFGTSSPKFWKPPSNGHLKLNADDGCHTPEAWCLGTVFRSENGSIVLAASKQVHGIFHPDITKALAVCWALQIAKSKGFNKVEVETDSLLLVHAFNRSHGLSYLDMVQDVFFFVSVF